MADRAEARRLHARQGRPAAPRDGQEEEGGAGRRVRAASRPACARTATRDGAIKALWDILRPVLRLRVQQGAHRGVRAGVVLDGLPQGELPGRVHGRAAHQRARRQGQVGALPERVPPDGHQGAAAGRQRVRRPTSPRSAPTSGSAWPRSATSAPTSSRRSSRPREAKGRFSSLRRLPAQGRRRWSATSAPSSRWSRPARSTPSATPGAGLVARPRGVRRRRSSTRSASRRRARTSLFGGFGDDGGAASSRCCRPIPTAEWDKSDNAARSSARCSGSTSPTTRCSASSTCSPRRPTARSPRCSPTRPRRTALGHHRRPDHRPAAQDDQAAATPGPSRTVEDLEGAIEVLFFPQAYQTVSTVLAEDLVVVVRGRLNRRDDVPTIYAAELTIPDITEGPRGPVVISHAAGAVHPAGRRAAQGVLATHPGVTEVHLRLHAGRPRHRDAARRRAAGHRRPGAVRRPQGAARPRLPGVLTLRPPRSDRTTVRPRPARQTLRTAHHEPGGPL